MRRVLHISADFPDAFDAAKPNVVRDLLHLTGDQFDHRVVSLNRRSPSFGALLAQLSPRRRRDSISAKWDEEQKVLALRYDAPSKGLFHKTLLLRLADQIAERLEGQPAPSLVVGHKLTIEGLVAERIAQRMGVEFGVTIQGNTDCRVLSARPDLAGDFSRIFHSAEVVFALAPWALRKFSARLGERVGHTALLPCPSPLTEILPPRVSESPHFVSAFHLRNFALKNLAGLAAATRQAHASSKATSLSIAGGGDAAETAQCLAIVGDVPAITLLGHVPQADLPALFNNTTAFVLPSRRESFGLVFIEALFAGIPIIYPADAAVDGYFDGASFAIRIDALDNSAIAEAMTHAARNEKALKEDLAQWQQSDDAQRFTQTAIAQTFAEGLAGNS